MDDVDIVRLLAERNQYGMECAIKKYEKYCYSISYDILKNKEDAEECVWNVFAKLWFSFPLKGIVDLKRYIRKITINTAINKYRINKLNNILFLNDDLLIENNIHYDMEKTIVEKIFYDQIIIAFLNSLGKNARCIFILRYIEKRSIKEISKQLHISESSVKTSLFRSRRRLMKTINEFDQ